MGSTLRNILKGGFQLSFARGGVFVIQALQNFVLASLLGPKGFGEVSLFNLIFQYARLAGFGIDTVACREIPGRIALGDMKRAETVKNMAFTCEMFLRGLVSLAVLMIGLFAYSGMLRIGIILVAFVVFVDKLSGLYFNIGSAYKKFGILSKGSLLSGFLMGMLTISLVKFTGVYTQLVCMLSVTSCMVIYYSKKLKLGIKPHFDTKALPPLLRMGMPFVGLTIVYTVWNVSGRTMTAASLDMTSLGLYSFANSCVLLVLAFLNDFQAAFQPAIYERMALTSERREIFALMRRPSLLFGYGTPVLIAFLFLIFPFLVRWIMPGYVDSIWIFRLLLFNVYMTNIGSMVIYLLKSSNLNKQSYLLFSYTLGAGLSYLCMWILLGIGLHITGIVIGVILGRVVAGVTDFILAHRYYIDGWREGLRYYCELMAPLPFLIGFCAVVLWIEKIEYIEIVLKSLIDFGLFLLLSGFLLHKLNMKTGIVMEVFKMVRLRGGKGV